VGPLCVLLSQCKEVELEVASDGERALKFIHSQRENPKDAQPCVILLDLHLPKHDGLEVLGAIRQEPALNHIHVVMVTSGASPRQEAELRRMGVEVRPKPMELSQFEDLAATLLGVCDGLRVAT